MRVLITNLYLASFSGSEVAVELLADGLRRAGHTPMVLAPTLGAQAARMRTRGHIVADRLSALPQPPDLIHAQHTTVALAAMAAFPGTPTVFACHSAEFEVEAPRPHPQIRRWIAVDDLCRARLLSRGAPETRLSVILNAVDLERCPRRAPLPAAPARALLLSKNTAHVDAVRQACAGLGIALDEIGPAFGRTSDQLERDLLDYDLVFATARMALEAAAAGCAVIVCDGRGFAGLLTSERLEPWRRLNFGAGLLTRPTTCASVREAIAGYDSSDAARVTAKLRAEASLDQCVAQHLAIYDAALADPAPTPSEVAMATATWIENLAPSASDRDWSVIARELFGFEASPWREAVEVSENRLAQRVTASATATIDALNSAGARIERLAENVSAWRGAAAGLEDRLAQRAAASHAATLDALAGVSAEIQRLATLNSLVSKSIANTRAIWRRAVPHAVRAPLFRFRQRLLGQPDPD